MPRRSPSAAALTGGIVGALILVEIVSGVLQTFYLPLVTPIARVLGINDADWNWFEAAQTLVAAVTLPLLARLGDLFGHKRILLGTIAVVAAASWGVAFAGGYWSFLVAWAMQAFIAVWLPLEIALVFDRGRRMGRPASATRKAAGLLVVGLEIGAVSAALLGGRMFTWLGGSDALHNALTQGTTPGTVEAITSALTMTLAVPAAVTTIVFFVVLFTIPESEPHPSDRAIDGIGLALLAATLLILMGAIALMRVVGFGDIRVWLLFALGAAVVPVFVRHELRAASPAIDIRVLRSRAMWPIQLGAGLMGIAILGTQVPVVAYVGTRPDIVGYGFGLDTAGVSLLIGAQVIMMGVSAVFFGRAVQRFGARNVMVVGASLVAVQAILFTVFVTSLAGWVVAIFLGGIGAGMTAAGTPAVAASAAPAGQTGIAAGMTNMFRTIGGAFGSAMFALALGAGETGTTASPLAGYLTVFLIAGVMTALAAVAFSFIEKSSLRDPDELASMPHI